MTLFDSRYDAQSYIKTLRHANLIMIVNSDQFNAAEKAKARGLLAEELLGE